MDDDFAYVFMIMITMALLVTVNIFYLVYILTLPKYEPKKSRKGLRYIEMMEISVGACGD